MAEELKNRENSDAAEISDEDGYQSNQFVENYMKCLKLTKENPLVPDGYSIGSHSLGRYYIARLMKWLDAEFSSGRYQGDRLLDLCSGPNIHSIISASRVFNEVIMTDRSATCRAAITRWLEKRPGSFDWSDYFAFVAEEECHCSELEVEERVRNSIKHICPYDLCDQPPFDAASVDCITDVLGIVAAASNQQMYKEMLKATMYMLRPGGSFLQVGVLNGNDYRVCGKVYPGLGMTEDFVMNAFLELGFKDIRFHLYPVPLAPSLPVDKSYYFLSAHL